MSTRLALIALTLPLISCAGEESAPYVPPHPFGLCRPPMVFFENGTARSGEWQRRQLAGRFLPADDPCSYSETIDPRSKRTFCLTGHADKTGSEAVNEQLAKRRAEAVLELLVQFGVSREYIAVRGRGSRQPLVDTPGPEPQDRRVEISTDVGDDVSGRLEKCK